MHTPPNPIPAIETAVPTVADSSDHSSWRCARCGRVVDQTKNIFMRPGTNGKRTKVWHVRCDGPGVEASK